MIKKISTVFIALALMIQADAQIIKKEYFQVPTKRLAIGYGQMLIAGAIHGAREAYHADRDVFERHWGVGDESWWGSESWKRKYQKMPDGTLKEAPHIGTLFSDFWHTSQFVSRSLVVSGTITITIGEKKKWYNYAIASIGGAACFAFTSNFTYNWLRNQ